MPIVNIRRSTAEALGDRVYQIRLLSGLHMYHRRVGDTAGLLPIALRAEAIARDLGDTNAIVGAQVMLGVSHHLNGSLAASRTALSAALRQPTCSRAIAANFFGFHRDPEIVLARTLWLQGFPDQAIAAAHASETLTQQDPVTACLIFIWGASVFHWTGNWAAAEEFIERLVQHAGEHSLSPYKSVGVGLKGDILVQRGEVDAGIVLLRQALSDLHVERYGLYIPWLNCTLALGLAAKGQIDQALDTVNEITSDLDRIQVYNAQELLRIRGALLEQGGDLGGAESCFWQSLTIADAQGALSWRLRTATSLARLLVRQDRLREARETLSEVYGVFSEGFESKDLVAAKLLITSLGTSSKPT